MNLVARTARSGPRLTFCGDYAASQLAVVHLSWCVPVQLCWRGVKPYTSDEQRDCRYCDENKLVLTATR